MTSRHQISVTKETWLKLEYYAHLLGDRGATVGGYADSIIRLHFALYGNDLEAWRKL